MRLYIYRRSPSEGAVRLAEALRLREVDARKQSKVPRRVRDNAVVFWGDYEPRLTGPGSRALNAVPVVGKLTELRTLRDAGVSVVRLCEGDHPCEGDRLLRAYNHHGGLDLLHVAGHLNGYYVHKEEFVREFRIHVMGGVSIRAGIKVPRTDNPHPWVRSYEGGWKLDYGQPAQEQIRQRFRDVAKAAVHALGLDFGAVDVGIREDGLPIVLEVNRAPGLEGQTVEKYADKIAAWLEGDDDDGSGRREVEDVPREAA